MSSGVTEDASPRQWKISLRLGGLLTVIMGAFTIQNGLRALTVVDDTAYGPYLTPGDICGPILILFGVIAVAGGVSALLRKFFPLALVGALLGMMGGGWLNFFLGVLAFAFFFFSDEDF